MEVHWGYLSQLDGQVYFLLCHESESNHKVVGVTIH